MSVCAHGGGIVLMEIGLGCAIIPFVILYSKLTKRKDSLGYVCFTGFMLGVLSAITTLNIVYRNDAFEGILVFWICLILPIVGSSIGLILGILGTRRKNNEGI
jgi:hypothetical protein